MKNGIERKIGMNKKTSRKERNEGKNGGKSKRKKEIMNEIQRSGVSSYYLHLSGILRFYFWRYGVWEEVLIDDRLPWIPGMVGYWIHTNNSNKMK